MPPNIPLGQRPGSVELTAVGTPNGDHWVDGARRIGNLRCDHRFHRHTPVAPRRSRGTEAAAVLGSDPLCVPTQLVTRMSVRGLTFRHMHVEMNMVLQGPELSRLVGMLCAGVQPGTQHQKSGLGKGVHEVQPAHGRQPRREESGPIRPDFFGSSSRASLRRRR